MTASPGDDGIVLDPTCSSAHAEIGRVRAYWESKRQGRRMPRREDISPAEMRDVLPILQLYDVLENGNSYVVRLIGTRIAAAFETEPTGKTFDASDQSLLVERMRQVFRDVARRHAPVIARAQRTAIASRNIFAVESIFLPLSQDDRTVDTVLAATVFAERPYWDAA